MFLNKSHERNEQQHHSSIYKHEAKLLTGSTLTQYGVVKWELGGVGRVLGECIETTREGIPQQPASGHMRVHAVLDDLGGRQKKQQGEETVM